MKQEPEEKFMLALDTRLPHPFEYWGSVINANDM
jgi:hypothetical protein